MYHACCPPTAQHKTASGVDASLPKPSCHCPRSFKILWLCGWQRSNHWPQITWRAVQGAMRCPTEPQHLPHSLCLPLCVEEQVRAGCVDIHGLCHVRGDKQVLMSQRMAGSHRRCAMWCPPCPRQERAAPCKVHRLQVPRSALLAPLTKSIPLSIVKTLIDGQALSGAWYLCWDIGHKC
jgi:hypothetical protein